MPVSPRLRSGASSIRDRDSDLRNGFVRTVLGDIEPSDLGVTYCHEHLIIDSPLMVTRFPHIHLYSVEAATEEVAACREAGAGAMVDAMPSGPARDVARLAEISRRTGVHLIASTGLHTERYYEGVEGAADPVELADRFIAEIADGADGTGHCCGVIKVATGSDGINDRARRLFEAGSLAHRRTGAPVITHCEEGLLGMEQIELLSTLGVSPQRVVLSHTDKVADPRYHRALLDTGVNLEYDQALRQPPEEHKGTAWLLSTMVEAGFIGQLMVGTDGARRTLWTSLGGSPGLAWLLTGFQEVLERWGIDTVIRSRLLVDNPKRWLTFQTT